ncbi:MULTISPECIES: DUF977 family protein [Klebsiella]|uniref:DUF977 family protein n=1 Tax=Klebsiella TaxID=570 RepID=UPI000E2DF7D3|nr:MULTISPECIES: DUF977 family protein [Klebsiella]EGT0066821.1 DUF977 family protein [Klebsiella michiganensis]HCB1752245.1 DUF977 family protein [Klebsiella oxytoca]EIW9130663.1 DUF977 family protein [Klebsiella pneumoniae]EIW9136651.1 DUF977 family protein [Klebsiella pneumoniae]WDI71914.1 DUF977 family protein [Klebsiella grimontii]
MANKSREQQQASVQKIIDLTRQKGRLTVKEACAELHMCRDAVGRHFHSAARTGKVIRYGRLGLFRDQRATIDFDLQRFSYRKNAGEAK